MKTKIVIVDDHAVLRAGLKMFLNGQPDMCVVGEAGTAKDAIQVSALSKPDVITLDLTMPGEGGLSLLKHVRREFSSVCVLILTMHDDPAYLKAALTAGAAGYVTKTAEETEVLAAIRAIRQGRTHFSSSMQGMLAETPTRPAAAAAGEVALSEREGEVLQMVARGLTNQQIADVLLLSVKTIEGYRSRLMAKLKLQSRADLVGFALRRGILATG